MKFRRHQEVLDAAQLAEKARLDLRVSSAVLANAIEEHRLATDALLAAIEEQKRGWATDV